MGEVVEKPEEVSNIEDMAKRYTAKWKVPLEEARRKVKEFIEKRPVDRTKVMPSQDNIFPEPVGPLSERIQDINQAALGSAFAQRSLREMNLPPKELEDLRDTMDTLMKRVDNVMELVNSKVSSLQSTLDTKQKAEDREALITELNAKIIEPIKADLANVKKAVDEKNLEKQGESLKDLKEKLRTAEEDAKGVLKDLGYPVPEAKAVVQGPVASVPQSDAELVEALKKRGYHIEFDMVSREDARKMAEEAAAKAHEDALDDKRIEAVENVVHDAVADLINLFKPGVDYYFKTVLPNRGAEPSKEPSA
jgi:DNA repair exonuclease SbcCD ATPase subunit